MLFLQSELFFDSACVKVIADMIEYLTRTVQAKRMILAADWM
jgi:hypothetical protein